MWWSCLWMRPALFEHHLAPLGAVLVGWLCDRGGTELAFGVGGICAIAMTLFGAQAISRQRQRIALVT